MQIEILLLYLLRPQTRIDMYNCFTINYLLKAILYFWVCGNLLKSQLNNNFYHPEICILFIGCRSV